MDWIIIALLILSGIGFIILEIIFVPGTTFVGFAGLFTSIYGVYRSYDLYGSSVGHAVLTVSIVLGIAAIIYSFKSDTWKKFALHSSMRSRNNENMTINLSLGSIGITVSSLKPIGKAEFEGMVYEVSSLGGFIEENQQIKIIKIERNKIHVEPIKLD